MKSATPGSPKTCRDLHFLKERCCTALELSWEERPE
jgi:hypothetical protein